MKKILLVSLFVLMTGSYLSAQNMRMDTPNVLTLELLGKCGAFAFTYDRNLDFFGPVGKFLGVGLGIFYGYNTGIYSFPFYLNATFGGDTAAFLVQGGAKLSNLYGEGDSSVGLRGYIGAGFEMRKPFVFRLMLYYNYIRVGSLLEGWIPWPGISFGMAF